MSNDTQMDRVDYDELELDDQLALLDGTPFTGIVFSLHRDGSLESEGLYLAGLPDGLQEHWYPGGALERRWLAIRGNGSSESWSWHRNGVMRSYRRYVDRRQVDLQVWDEHGRPVDPAAVPDPA